MESAGNQKVDLLFFETLADWADYERLSPYEGKKKFWVLVTDSDLQLAQVCLAFAEGEKSIPLVNSWVEEEKILIR